jgi:hypothetical protein
LPLLLWRRPGGGLADFPPSKVQINYQ